MKEWLKKRYEYLIAASWETWLWIVLSFGLGVVLTSIRITFL